MMAIYHTLQLKPLSHLTFVLLKFHAVFSLKNKSRLICFIPSELSRFLHGFSCPGSHVCVSALKQTVLI